MKSFWIVLLACTLFTTTSHAQDDSLLAHFPFDYTLEDVSGYERHGRFLVHNYRFVEGQNGNALEVLKPQDGGRCGYFVADNFPTEYLGEFSLSFWFKSRTELHYAHLLKKIMALDIRNGSFYSTPLVINQRAIDFKDSIAIEVRFLTDDDSIYNLKFHTDSNWTHFTLSFDSNNKIRLYKNGELKSELSTRGVKMRTFELIQIGEPLSSSDCPQEIVLDDLKLYRKALSPQKIQQQVGVGINSRTETILMYPNPVEDYLYLNQSYHQLILFDCSGKKILEAERGEMKLDISGLSDGLYFVELTDKNGNRWVKRLVKK